MSRSLALHSWGMDGVFILDAPPKVRTTPTGFGDEVYYHDEDGFLRHFPTRTKYSHPYSYDPIVLFNTGAKGDASAYSDRMVGWDYDKFYGWLGL